MITSIEITELVTNLILIASILGVTVAVLETFFGKGK